MIVYGEEERIAGIHVLGEGMDEAAQFLGVAVKLGARKSDFDGTVAIHPTSAEELVTMPPQMARAAKA
jgi:glutathione reductase (NADPH)